MPSYKVAGYEVRFPHQAYGVQLGYMNSVLRALDRETNALLEAPTGCGKTLSLLCASLAWQSRWKEDAAAAPPLEEEVLLEDALLLRDEENHEHEREQKGPKRGKEAAKEGKSPTSGAAASAASSGPRQQRRGPPPKIYYGSRTHSQIAQVVKELKRSGYSPRIAILASREHYCIHPQVSKAPARDQECEKLMRESEHGCSYFNNVRKLIGGKAKVRDIEDLRAAGKRATACPYFAARNLAEDAEVVFCPYNYLLDPVVRSAMDIQVAGAVVILDEAHNVEDVARDAASCDVALSSILTALDAFSRARETAVTRPDLYIPVEGFLERLVGWLQSRASGGSLRPQGFERFEAVWSGAQMVSELEEAGLSAEGVDILWATLGEVRSFEDSDRPKAGGWGANQGPVEGPREPPGDSSSLSQQQPGELKAGGMAIGTLSRLLTVLHLMYQGSVWQRSSYRLAMQKSVKRDGSGAQQAPVAYVSAAAASAAAALEGWEVLVSVWALSPSVAVDELAATCHSLVLTSGTLAPTSSFGSELGVRFPIVLEAPHVVDTKRQVWAGVLPVGPSGKPLTATFKHTSTFEFQDSVGQVILETARAVPQGMLVFLPSYSLLDKLMERWKATKLLKDLKKVKRVVVEPRARGGEFEAAIKLYCHSIESGKGGLLFAVCRGKASEGIDFADAQARAVVVVGIPFPNVKDTKVGLKKAFNDSGRGQGLLCGDMWYSQQAFRCLNQAIGRCIRHRYDYGAVILLDDRFRQPRNQSMLSRWVKGVLQVQRSFPEALESLKGFFDRIVADPPRNPNAIEAAPEKKAKASDHHEKGASFNKGPQVQGTLAQAWGLPMSVQKPSVGGGGTTGARKDGVSLKHSLKQHSGGGVVVGPSEKAMPPPAKRARGEAAAEPAAGIKAARPRKANRGSDKGPCGTTGGPLMTKNCAVAVDEPEGAAPGDSSRTPARSNALPPGGGKAALVVPSIGPIGAFVAAEGNNKERMASCHGGDSSTAGCFEGNERGSRRPADRGSFDDEQRHSSAPSSGPRSGSTACTAPYDQSRPPPLEPSPPQREAPTRRSPAVSTAALDDDDGCGCYDYEYIHIEEDDVSLAQQQQPDLHPPPAKPHSPGTTAPPSTAVVEASSAPPPAASVLPSTPSRAPAVTMAPAVTVVPPVASARAMGGATGGQPTGPSRSKSGAVAVSVASWIEGDLEDFAAFLSDRYGGEENPGLRTVDDRREMAAGGILDCFKLARELVAERGCAEGMESMWETWCCTVPRGMRAALHSSGLSPPPEVNNAAPGGSRICHRIKAIRGMGLPEALAAVHEAYEELLAPSMPAEPDEESIINNSPISAAVGAGEAAREPQGGSRGRISPKQQQEPGLQAAPAWQQPPNHKQQQNHNQKQQNQNHKKQQRPEATPLQDSTNGSLPGSCCKPGGPSGHRHRHQTAAEVRRIGSHCLEPTTVMGTDSCGGELSVPCKSKPAAAPGSLFGGHHQGAGAVGGGAAAAAADATPRSGLKRVFHRSKNAKAAEMQRRRVAATAGRTPGRGGGGGGVVMVSGGGGTPGGGYGGVGAAPAAASATPQRPLVGDEDDSDFEEAADARRRRR